MSLRNSPFSENPDIHPSTLFHQKFIRTSPEKSTCVELTETGGGWVYMQILSLRRGTFLVVQWLTICLQCRGHGFDSWSGNEDPICRSHLPWNLRATTREKPQQDNERSCMPQLSQQQQKSQEMGMRVQINLHKKFPAPGKLLTQKVQEPLLWLQKASHVPFLSVLNK